MDELIREVLYVINVQRSAGCISNQVQPPFQYLASIWPRRIPKPVTRSLVTWFGELRLDRHRRRIRDDHEIGEGRVATPALHRYRELEAQVGRWEQGNPDSGAELSEARFWRPPEVDQGQR